jgi:adenosylcobinamide-GDP ribazoletransferase
MKRLLLALQFLTIVPCRASGSLSEKEIAGSAVFFPVVGALQGLLLLVAAFLLSFIFPPDIVSGFLVAILIISNGGFHMDGLADTFDALAVKFSGDVITDRERRLAVMKDSLTGPIGVVALILVILMQYILIRNILSFPQQVMVFLILFLMPVFSRWAMVPALYHGVPARSSGLGKIFIDGASVSSLIYSYALVLIFFAGFSAACFRDSQGLKGLIFLILMPVAHFLAWAWAGGCKKLFGGLNGDTLGALSELSGIFYLAGAYIWLQHFI